MQKLINHKRIAHRPFNGKRGGILKCFLKPIIIRARFEPFEYKMLTGDYLTFHAEMVHYEYINQPIY